MRINRSVCLIPALAVSLFCAAAGAQTYPSKPIRLQVGFPAGGPTDVVGRIIADKLSQQVGQPVIVENRPGVEAFGTAFRDELARWTKLAKEAGIKAD